MCEQVVTQLVPEIVVEVTFVGQLTLAAELDELYDCD